MTLRHFLSLFILFFSVTLHAQNIGNDFKNEWQEIDTLILKKNLTKSALEKVKLIYQQAKEKKMSGQVIKSLIYQNSLEENISSENQNKTIPFLQQEIASASDETEKAILYVLLAKQYRNYFSLHQWNIYNRKTTINVSKEDITTWGTQDFSNAIAKSYQLSLQNKKQLQQTSIEPYEAALIKGNSRSLRPTMYDLLAHEVLDYFNNADLGGLFPVTPYNLTDKNMLAPANTFLTAKFVTNDSSASKWQGLQLYQQLMEFHKNDTNKNAFLQLDLERLEWAYEKLNNADKENIFKNTLEELINTNAYLPLMARAWYRLAKLEYDKATYYQPFGDTSNRYSYLKAESIIEKALAVCAEGNSSFDDLKNLLTDIHTKTLRLETEKINVPYKPFRALVSFRNTDSLFLRIIRIDNNDSVKNQIRASVDFWKKINTLPVFRSTIQVLPANTDYQTHSAEIKIDGLPVGEYAILSSNRKEFADSTSNLFISYLYVSNISYIKNKNDFFVLNRETGAPIEGVKVTILKQQYISRLRKNIDDTIGIRTTNKNGYFRFEPNSGVDSYRYLFAMANDKLNFTGTEFSSPDITPPPSSLNDSLKKVFETSISRIFFFTDRAIYRPGQTVFFKGISVTKDITSLLSKLYIPKDSVLVNLKDVNGKVITSQKFIPNSYGSFTGQFILPQNLLTGNFSIDANISKNNPALSAIRFSVEEYKRPKFSIAFDKVTGIYRLNDSITVTGSARALAGNSIDGAKVKFNIIRNVRFQDMVVYRRLPIRNSNREISSGEIVTDPNGKFTIRFKAAADDIISKEGNPLFDFNIHTDITDLTGETRSANINIAVGFCSILLQLNLLQNMEADSFRNIKLITTNLMREKKPANVSVRIYSLESPTRLIRKRYWQQPDQFIYSEKEFIKYFPTDEYANETAMTNLKQKAVVSEGSVNTAEKDQFTISDDILPAGYYKIEAIAKDKYGEETKQIRYIQLFNRKNNQLASPAYQFNYSAKNFAVPDENISFLSGTSANSIYVISKTDRPGELKNNYDFEYRKAGIKNILFTPTETDRGGVSISEVFVIDNRVYTSQFYINVPFSNKELKIKYATYRDKTEPGSTEKWTVSIRGNKDEKTDAELLTTMYDASLDQFRSNNWMHLPFGQGNINSTSFNGYLNFSNAEGNGNYLIPKHILNKKNQYILFDRLPNNGQELWGVNFRLSALREGTTDLGDVNSFELSDKVNISGKKYFSEGLASNAQPNITLSGNVGAMKSVQNFDAYSPVSALAPIFSPVIRKNFNETAFFFPQLYADTSGNYSFSFTMPEALTQWKWMSFAHTKDLATGIQTANIITQKTMMVQPNAPRFLREGDNIEMSSKIVNLSDKEITGQITLELLDAATNTSVDGWFQNIFPSQYFTVEAGQSSAVKFPIQIPFSFNRPLKWRIVAKAGEFSDGEENVLPVLTNRTLVTESMPLFLSGDSTRHFVMDKLLKNKSETLTHQGITVEYTSNPVWTAVHALPYLMEYPYECAEQTFNRFYANALGAYLVNKYPNIKQILEKWKTDSVSVKSNLQKNEELKEVLLQETPWVLQAENEAQQKKNISLLFDLVKLGNQTESLIENLNQLQLPNGAFPWFKGGYEDRYITNYILIGIGKLKRLGAISPEIAASIKPLLLKALKYSDEKIADDYSVLIKNKHNLEQQNISSTQIDYLYMRSFFRDMAKQAGDAYDYYYKQGKQYWIKQNTYYKAQLGLIYYRTGDEKFATNTILPALTENAVIDSKLGIYWKSTFTGYWYQSPIEHQSMMIAFMSELNNDKSTPTLTKNLNAMKTWLLLNKQTNNWKTTIATADACYALLLSGTDWLSADKNINIQLGKYTINSSNEKTEAGTGYFKKRIDGKEVNNEMGNIVVSARSEVRGTNKPSTSITQTPSWGSIYWQYFEELDKITPSASPLSINKKLFIERNTDKGKVLDPVNENEELKVGDKIVVRLELRSDRDMDYLHLKDMRASSMEPVNVLSGYKWQDGLGYYESTKDVSSNFFIDHLRKGTYVFEYPLFITHTGLFSVGIATIQSMYAPEFNSHSKGIKIRVSTTN